MTEVFHLFEWSERYEIGWQEVPEEVVSCLTEIPAAFGRKVAFWVCAPAMDESTDDGVFEDMEAVGEVWDALTQKARETIMEHARACDAAIALIEGYRSPPRHSRACPTCWRRDSDSRGPVLRAPNNQNKKPFLRSMFRFVEVDIEGMALEPLRRAQLLVCSERKVFDEEALDFYRDARCADFCLTMILHTGGKVARAVHEQNILRERKGSPAAPGATWGDERLAPRVEVHTHVSIILHGTHAHETDYRIVPATEAYRVVDLYDNRMNLASLLASLPPVDASSREVMLTGALERDLVQAIEPQGIALVLVTPLAHADADYEYERLLRELREQPQRWQKREDLSRRIRNVVSVECTRVLEDSAGPHGLESWRAILQWVDSRAFSEARGSGNRSRQVFGALKSCAPCLHAQIEAVLENDQDEEALQDDLLMSAVVRGVYAIRNRRAVAAAIYSQNRCPVEEEESHSGSEAPRTPAFLPATPPPHSSSGRSTPSPGNSSPSSVMEASSEDDKPPYGGALHLAQLQALLVGDSDDDDEEEEKGLECLRPRDFAFVQAVREKLRECGVRYSKEEFDNMLLHVDKWYEVFQAEPDLGRHAFWEKCRRLGLPASLTRTLQHMPVSTTHGTLPQEIGAVEHWLQQGARVAPSREEGNMSVPQ